MPELEVANLIWKNEVAKGDAYGFAKVQDPNRQRDRLHCHKDFAEVFWVEEGQGLHVVNGANIPVAVGDVVMVRPGDAHNFEPVDKPGFRFVNVTFPLATISYLKQRYFRNIPGFYDTRAKAPLKKAMSADMKMWMEHAVPALAQAPRTRLEIEAFLITLFHGLFHPSIEAKMETCPDWIRFACENIRKPEYLPLGVPAFMKLAGRSQEHVARECKKWLGKTPTELVNVARMEYTAQQLSNKENKVTDIAFAAGFRNLAHFYRLFLKQFGTTPRKYRLRTSYGFPPETHFPYYFKPEFTMPKNVKPG